MQPDCVSEVTCGPLYNLFITLHGIPTTFKLCFLNQVHGFLKSLSCGQVRMCVCVCTLPRL